MSDTPIELKEIKPIGQFLLDSGKGQQCSQGMFYHYSDVCVLLQQYAHRALAEARAEIERLNNKLSLLLCEDHVKSCESGLFNSKYPEDEPCLLCLIDIRQNQVEIDFKAKDKLIEQMKDALQRLRDEEKPTTYHDCIDDGVGECAWCQSMAALSAAERGE